MKNRLSAHRRRSCVRLGGDGGPCDAVVAQDLRLQPRQIRRKDDSVRLERLLDLDSEIGLGGGPRGIEVGVAAERALELVRQPR